MLFTQTITSNKDFLFLYKRGTSIVSKAVVVYFRKNNKPFNRLGITASKKIGNAVKRNRARRIIRQAYSENELSFPIGYDIIIVARGLATAVKSTYVSKFMADKLIKEIIAFEEKAIKK